MTNVEIAVAKIKAEIEHLQATINEEKSKQQSNDEGIQKMEDELKKLKKELKKKEEEKQSQMDKITEGLHEVTQKADKATDRADSADRRTRNANDTLLDLQTEVTELRRKEKDDMERLQYKMTQLHVSEENRSEQITIMKQEMEGLKNSIQANSKTLSVISETLTRLDERQQQQQQQQQRQHAGGHHAQECLKEQSEIKELLMKNIKQQNETRKITDSTMIIVSERINKIEKRLSQLHPMLHVRQPSHGSERRSMPAVNEMPSLVGRSISSSTRQIPIRQRPQSGIEQRRMQQSRMTTSTIDMRRHSFDNS